MIYYYIKFSNEIPIERSESFESENSPEIIDSWEAVWTEAEWNNYVASIPIIEAPSPENSTAISDFYDMVIDNYSAFRESLLNIVLNLGEGNMENGFETLTNTEKEFVALNAIGTKEQIDSVLFEPSVQMLDFLSQKQVLK